MAATPAIAQDQMEFLVDSDQGTGHRAARQAPGIAPRTDGGTVTASWDPYDIWLNRVQKPRRERQRAAGGNAPGR